MMLPPFVLVIVAAAGAAVVAGFIIWRVPRLYRRRHLDAVRTLMALVDAGDVLTRGHSYRVSRLSLRLGRQLGMRGGGLAELEYAALLHDVGRIAIRADVLQKPGPLSADERSLVQTHPDVGHDIVKGLGFFPGAAEIIRSHHEQPDGKGYPRALRGKDIPLGARIIMVAAALEAMTVDRPYRRGMKPVEAMAELSRHAGTQFDADIVAALQFLHAEGTLYDDLDTGELARLTHRWSPSGVDEELYERKANARRA
ncbi:MAG TPA: HD-GYP domain-containing protein [Candidatus Eisenbacteria bacterium]